MPTFPRVGVAVCFPGLLSLLACTGVVGGSDGRGLATGNPDATSPGSAGPAGAPSDVDAQPIGALSCDVRHAPEGRIWRLSAEQYRASMLDAFGLAVDVSSIPPDGINQYTGFTTGSADNYVTLGFADVAWDAAQTAAETNATALVASFPCLASTADQACVTTVLAEVAGRAFRRPLLATETERYQNFFEQQRTDYDLHTALGMLLEAIANSPYFLYRTELGDGSKGVVTLTQHEIAMQLAYMLSDAPPSEVLRQAADAGQLSDRATVATFANALLASDAARTKLDQFTSQYLQLSGLEAKVGDPALADSMSASTRAFVAELALSRPGTLTELFDAPIAYVDETLAPLYGVGAAGTDLIRVELDPSQRGGILTQLAFLSSQQGPIHRGRLLKEGFLCGEIPAPPPGASLQKDKLAGPDPDATEQQRWQSFRDLQPCGGCHTLFQPLGIAFDHYDELGRFRDANPAGRGIDARGTVAGAGDADGEFGDGVALSKQIAASKTGQYCFTKRYMSFALGRDVSTGRDACALKSVGDQLIGSGLQLRELFIAITQDDSFYQRNNVE